MVWKELLSTLTLTILIILVGFAGFLLYDIYFAETQFFDILVKEDNTPIFNATISDEYPDGILFYDNLRFKSNKVSYSIDSMCNENRAFDAREAFGILEENTILVFTEKSDGEIKVICEQTSEEPNEEYFIAGEGGPNYIINATNYYIAFNGTIFLYRDNNCNKPVVAMHEILHVFGFTHSVNERSIMYEISKCNQKLTQEIIDTINNLYSTPSLPDLIITDVNAEKTGRFLDFQIEILNAGLDYSSKSSFSIFADGEKIVSYDLDGLTAGTGRSINVSNLRVPRNIDELSFFVDFESTIFEINEDNNEKILIING